MQPIYKFGGDGPLIHLATANGFSPPVYKPLVDPLTRKYRVVSLPPRALWPGATVPEQWVNWKEGVAQDLITGLRDHDLHDLIAIGHSIGGVATVIAATTEPERFKAVILLDPTILPQPYLWTVAFLRLFGVRMSHGLADRAQKRRFEFESVDDAYAYFRGKRLFADWPDETVHLYAESLIPAGNGRMILAWPREWEAYYFRTLYTGTWRELPKLQGTVPVLTVRGERSNTLFPKAAARMRRILPQMAYAEIAGHGHLFPQSAPDQTRRIITEWLADLS